MTPEEELKRLNRLIRQYETVFRTTPDPDQRERVERQLKELQSYREKILAVNVIDGRKMEEMPEGADEFAEYPILALLRQENAAAPPGRGVAQFSARDVTPTSTQTEMFHLALYARHFELEFLPFLTEKQLKLDFTFSMDRDGFYTVFQSLQRRIGEYREENRRLAEGMVSRDMETETRKRAFKLTRLIGVEAARFFRTIGRFCDELGEDARGDAVKCLNCEEEISFDMIEGSRLLQGRKVSEALAELEDFASEVVEFLNIPELETPEKERADRH
jgi:hypothetical protein